MGWVGILSSAKGLLRLILPRRSHQEVQQQLRDIIDRARRSPSLFQDLVERLRTYFTGHQVTFPDQLDLHGATSFQRSVWEQTRLIPYGETRSYTWVAEQIRKPRALRAVGQSLGKNPLPIIIPCHRVVTASGKPGGYSGGPELKRYLLRLEAQSRKG